MKLIMNLKMESEDEFGAGKPHNLGSTKNSRNNIVRDYMKKHNCKMIEASQMVKKLNLYKK